MTKTHPQNHRFGYARVSTVGQTLDSQLEQLRAAGCTNKIYREKVTSAHSDRRELLKMLAALAPGDVVTVTRIDRRARSTFDMFGALSYAVAAREVPRARHAVHVAAGLGLLCHDQFWSPAHVLPALLRPAAALSGAGTVAKPPSMAAG
jgi:hypothetical protein